MNNSASVPRGPRGSTPVALQRNNSLMRRQPSAREMMEAAAPADKPLKIAHYGAKMARF
jgi:hypothetical protein